MDIHTDNDIIFSSVSHRDIMYTHLALVDHIGNSDGGVTFTDLITNLAHQKKTEITDKFLTDIQRLCVDLIEDERLIIREEDNEAWLYNKLMLSEKVMIKIMPTNEELEGNYLLLGDRLTPYLYIDDESGMPTVKYGGEQLKTKELNLCFDKIKPYISLLGFFEGMNVLMTSSAEKQTQPAPNPGEDCLINVYDMTKVYKNMKSGYFCVEVSLKNGMELSIVDEKSEDVNFAEIKKFISCLDKELLNSNEQLCGVSAAEQLNQSYFKLPMNFIKRPPLSLDRYCKLTKKLVLEFNGSGLSFCPKGKKIPQSVIEENMYEMASVIKEVSEDIEAEQLNSSNENNIPAVYTFKVAFDHQKRTYCKIDIHSANTWEDLHNAIQQAVKFENDHLYSFYFTEKATKSLQTRMSAPEISSPFSEEEWNANEILIGNCELELKEKLYYLFDYGDEWWFECTVMKRTEGGNVDDYPIITDVKGKLPEQYPEEEDDYCFE